VVHRRRREGPWRRWPSGREVLMPPAWLCLRLRLGGLRRRGGGVVRGVGDNDFREALSRRGGCNRSGAEKLNEERGRWRHELGA